MYDNENDKGYYNSSDENNTDGYYNSSENNSENSSENIEENNFENSVENSSENDSGNYYNSSDNYYSNPGGNDYNKEPNKKKNKTPIIIVTVVAAAVLLITAFVITISIVYKDISSDDLNSIANSSQTEEKNNYETIGSTDTSSSSDNSTTGSFAVTDVSGVVDSSMPSVVAITSKTLVESSNNYSQDIFDYYFGGGSGNGNGGSSYEQEAAGSGIIIDQTDSELLIVTNNHVVEGADSLKIQFNGEESKDSVDGYIKGTDSNADIAIVAVKVKDIKSSTLKSIKKATMGDSDAVKVGEGVVAIGNALGYGQSVTTGVISAKDREATIENKTMKLLQTDAAINGGNSGGALLNAKGEVIGINVAKYSSSGSTASASVEGMGFAIPISSVKSIISNLETKKTRTKVDEDKQGYLGIQGNDVPDDVTQQYGIPKGAYVYSLVDNGPADKAGIEVSDVITKFDGQSVSTMSELQSVMEYYKSGEKVKVTVSYRSGKSYKEKEVTVTLGDKSTVEDLQQSKNN